MSKFTNLEHLEQVAQKVDDIKQDKITGEQGQIVGFGADGKPKAQDLPKVEVIKSHGQMEGRDEADQHPISAITGLTDELKKIKELAEGKQDPIEFATTEEVDEMLDNVFGTSATQPGEGGGSSGECGCTNEIASDEEVDAMLNGVFGR